MTRAAGFTLLELLILLAVLGILLGIASMAGAQWRMNTALNNFVAELATDINATRTVSLSTGELRRVRIVDAKQFVIERKTGTTWANVETVTALKNVFTLTSTSARRFEFTTRGTVDTFTDAGGITTNSQVVATVGSTIQTIKVTALGIARLQ